MESFIIVFNLQMLNVSMFSPNFLGRQNDGKNGKFEQKEFLTLLSSALGPRWSLLRYGQGLGLDIGPVLWLEL